MTTTNPIVPPPELVQQWWAEETYDPFGVAISRLATQAAQWGADQELGACCTAIDEVPGGWADSRHLRHVRRPKPPSLKEQALEALEALPTPAGQVTADRLDTIRRALEALDD
jgi:hypothetical protein